MYSKFEKIVLKIFAFSFIGLLFIFIFTWIIFDFQNSSNSLKDTWSIVASIFGGYATLVAAYIAMKLLGIWKDQELFNHKRKLHQDGIEALKKIAELLNKLKHAYSPITNIDDEEKLTLIENSFNVSQSLMISYKTDYMNAVDDDENLMKIYGFCSEFYDLVKVILLDIDNGIHLIQIGAFEDKFSKDIDDFINSLHQN